MRKLQFRSSFRWATSTNMLLKSLFLKSSKSFNVEYDDLWCNNWANKFYSVRHVILKACFISILNVMTLIIMWRLFNNYCFSFWHQKRFIFSVWLYLKKALLGNGTFLKTAFQIEISLRSGKISGKCMAHVSYEHSKLMKL